jgi:hypothetical protein
MGSSRALRRHSNQAPAAPDPAIRRFPAARGEHEASVHSHATRPFRAKVDHYEMRRPRASHTQELRKAHPLDAETKRKKINHSIQGLKGPRVSSQLPASNHQPETGKSIYETKPFPLRRVGPELHDAMVDSSS